MTIIQILLRNQTGTETSLWPVSFTTDDLIAAKILTKEQANNLDLLLAEKFEQQRDQRGY